MYFQANSVVLREVHVDAWLHKFIIGRKGANINSLTQNFKRVGDICCFENAQVTMTYCVRQVNIEFQSEENKILIEGPPEEADVAQDALQLKVDELVRPRLKR